MGAGFTRTPPFIVTEAEVNWRVLLRRSWAWLFPVPRWKDRLLAYIDGNAVWAVPGRPDMMPMSPWPPEWCVLEAVEASDDGAPAHMKLVDGVSLISSRVAEGEDAVRCCRCGITLHVTEAHMGTSIDVPACSWCIGAVRRVR